MADSSAVPVPLMRMLGAAAREHGRVAFTYRAEGASPGTRSVDPYRLVLHERHSYLLCWDLRRKDWRTFRLDRMADVEPTGVRFRPRRIPGDAAAVHADADAPARRTTLRFEAPIDDVGARLLGQEAELEDLGDGRCRILLWVDSYELLAAIALSMGVDFGIEEPAEFRAHCTALRDRLDRALRNES